MCIGDRHKVWFIDMARECVSWLFRGELALSSDVHVRSFHGVSALKLHTRWKGQSEWLIDKMNSDLYDRSI